MTRNRTYILTAVSAGLFILLSWAFADGLFRGDLWNSDNITNSAIWTYVLLALIVAAGIYQAQKLPQQGVALQPVRDDSTPGQVNDPKFWSLLLGNAYLAILWLPLRFFVGRAWLSAGEGKVRSDTWGTGTPLQGYWERAVAIPEQGSPAITYDWYRNFIQYMLDRGWYTWFADLIAWGEVLVGIGLLVGALVGISAFFGTLMNFNFQLAGTVSSNPVLFGLSVFLVLGWKVAGWWGVDRWLLPILGTPWQRLEERSDSTNVSTSTGPRRIQSV